MTEQTAHAVEVIDSSLRTEIHVCTCGCYQFFLLRSGECECYNCGRISSVIRCYDLGNIVVH